MAKRIEAAEEAGVFAATVPHVLNNLKYASPEPRQKVLDTAKKESQHRRFRLSKEAFEQSGIAFRSEYVEDYNPEHAVTSYTGYEAMKKLYTRAPEITAVFCVNDQ